MAVGGPRAITLRTKKAYSFPSLSTWGVKKQQLSISDSPPNGCRRNQTSIDKQLNNEIEEIMPACDPYHSKLGIDK